jgi:hypothetical protein
MQNFKGDDLEKKFEAVGQPSLDITGIALDDFTVGAFEASPFLLMLYDSGRMPFSNRIPRKVFVDFIKKALENFPVTGTFEAYLFVLRQIFGDASEIFFDIPNPGKLEIDINATATLEFEFLGREFVSGAYQFFDITDDDDNILVFRGIAGIDTEHELKLLFSEIMPIGITPNVALTFYLFYSFIADDGDNMITDIGDQILFREIG